MLRRIKQWFVDAELVAVSRDLERAADQLSTCASRLELLEGRFQRLQNRLQMRLARQDLSGDRDAEILAQIRQHRGNNADDEGAWERNPPRDW